MSKLTIKYFGVVAEITDKTEEELNFVEGLSVDQLLEQCLQKYPGLKEVSFKIAQNQKITESGRINAMDEIAFLPPFSGG